MGKRPALILFLAFAVFAAAYVGSPLWAAQSLKQAALAGDKDRLDALVDFPAVRESLKSQLTAAITKKMADDGSMKDNPFAALGALIIPAMIDKGVDAYVTVDGIAALAKGQKPADAAARRGSTDPDIDTSYSFIGLDRFRVRLRNTRTNEDGPTFVFERHELFSWKMIRIDLPADFLDRRASSPDASATPAAESPVSPMTEPTVASPPPSLDSSQANDQLSMPVLRNEGDAALP